MNGETNGRLNREALDVRSMMRLLGFAVLGFSLITQPQGKRQPRLKRDCKIAVLIAQMYAHRSYQ